jgi:hypothetical protein
MMMMMMVSQENPFFMELLLLRYQDICASVLKTSIAVTICFITKEFRGDFQRSARCRELWRYGIASSAFVPITSSLSPLSGCFQ